MPLWERESWRSVFDVFGPLDWRRADLLGARVNQFQAAPTKEPLKEFILFRDPTDRQREKRQTETDLLAAFGYTGE